MRRRFVSITAVSLGAVLLVGAGAFRVWAVPALVRFPLNVDVTTHYSGTALTYVDQKTLLPLARPRSEPLSISRHVKAVGGSTDRAVVDETVTVTTGATANAEMTSVETYRYVIDRRSMQMVSDPRSYAFGDTAATMHAAGSYRVNFAMGTDAGGSYRAFVPEADVTVPLVVFKDPHDHSDAHIPVIDFTSKIEHPVAPYYLAHLKAMGLPMQVTAAQLQPLLLADGIDVARALADVGPRLTPAESKLVTDTLSKSVTLQYFFIDNGLVSIEPNTGAIIDVHAQEQGVAVQPDLTGASALQPLLDKYAAIPSVKALSDGLAAVAAKGPQLAENYRYTQTIPSSLAAASDARKNLRTMRLVEVQVPWAMTALGLIFLALGLIGWRRGRRTGSDESTPPRPSISSDRFIPEPVLHESVLTPSGPSRVYEGV